MTVCVCMSYVRKVLKHIRDRYHRHTYTMRDPLFPGGQREEQRTREADRRDVKGIQRKHKLEKQTTTCRGGKENNTAFLRSFFSLLLHSLSPVPSLSPRIFIFPLSHGSSFLVVYAGLMKFQEKCRGSYMEVNI